jgi:hypothetical protein
LYLFKNWGRGIYPRPHCLKRLCCSRPLTPILSAEGREPG